MTRQAKGIKLVQNILRTISVLEISKKYPRNQPNRNNSLGTSCLVLTTELTVLCSYKCIKIPFSQVIKSSIQ